MPRSSSRAGASVRQHTTTACTACRRSKIKCDGNTPICGQCLSRNRNCLFDSGPDRRRISARKSIKIFSARVRQLQDFIVMHGLKVPPPHGQQQTWTLDALMEAYPSSPSDDQANEPTESNALAGLPVLLPSDVGPGQVNGSLRETPETMTVTDTSARMPGSSSNTGLPPSMDWPNDLLFDTQSDSGADWVWNLPVLDESFTGNDQESASAAALMDLCASVSGPSMFDAHTRSGELADGIILDEDHDEVTSQISERMGGLLANKEGRWRFYGATSNLHLAKGRSILWSRPRAHQEQLALNSARLKLLELDQPIDPSLEQHFINLYFSWHNASMYIVDQEYFEQGRKAYMRDHKQSEFYSEFLANAIYAVGAALESDSHLSLPRPLPSFFAQRARALLELELDEPKVATVQGLAILSSHEASFMHDTRAWLFSGMAVRLAFDLGLHISTRKHILEGSMSHEEANARNVAVWGCFLNDRGCGLYLGRPFHADVKDLACEPPIVNRLHNSPCSWSAVISLDDPTEQKQSLPNPQNLVLEKWISLHLIMSTLGHQLYACESTTNLELQGLAQKTFEQLLDWRRGLPADVDLDVSSLDSAIVLPHVLVLHMHYALLIIALHRPFCSRFYIQPQPPVGRGPEHAREMCISSAVNIAKLLVCYRSQYTLHRANSQVVHIAFTAALILVYATVSGITSEFRSDLVSHLDTCCEALSELGEAFGNANRALDVLLAAKRSWQARMVTRS